MPFPWILRSLAGVWVSPRAQIHQFSSCGQTAFFHSRRGSGWAVELSRDTCYSTHPELPHHNPPVLFYYECQERICRLLTGAHLPGHDDWWSAGHLTQARPIMVSHSASVHSDWSSIGHLTQAQPIMVPHSTSVHSDWLSAGHLSHARPIMVPHSASVHSDWFPN